MWGCDDGQNCPSFYVYFCVLKRIFTTFNDFLHDKIKIFGNNSYFSGKHNKKKNIEKSCIFDTILLKNWINNYFLKNHKNGNIRKWTTKNSCEFSLTFVEYEAGMVTKKELEPEKKTTIIPRQKEKDKKNLLKSGVIVIHASRHCITHHASPHHALGHPRHPTRSTSRQRFGKPRHTSAGRGTSRQFSADLETWPGAAWSWTRHHARVITNTPSTSRTQNTNRPKFPTFCTFLMRSRPRPRDDYHALNTIQNLRKKIHQAYTTPSEELLKTQGPVCKYGKCLVYKKSTSCTWERRVENSPWKIKIQYPQRLGE